ncbi:MAG TPA: dTDP-4-amino-4,6-dideoxygalactose transaminase [Gammaproteobacteria bacterium]|nr:dTDP-4-amino-4,6-dideoxygalactose transaminase [Gammaproteobacteria bacterium]
MKDIRFNYPHATGREIEAIQDAIQRGHLSGNGPYSKKCHAWLEKTIGSHKALLTHSCTAALEMAAILSDVGPGDEVIMPSYTFVSTANAFVLRGATPVFVDVRPDTLNLDERLIEAAITPRTKVIAVVHYAGVGCEMDVIMDIARRHKLMVIEDAAQGIHASYKGKPLGSIGHLAALSFHETKNVISGEGGALLVNDSQLAERAEIIWEKGTNRSQFFRGQVDKYTWVDVGSSFLPSELIAAFLWPQLEDTAKICARRLEIWHDYHSALKSLRDAGRIQGPVIPDGRAHNAHMYYTLASNAAQARAALDELKTQGIGAIPHYVPLHSSPAGRRFGRSHGELKVTDEVWRRLIRFPLWPDMTREDTAQVSDAVMRALGNSKADKRSVS